MPSALRIYYLHPLYAGSVPEWDAHLDRCATMGFDSVLIAPPFRTGKTKSLFLASDHNCTDPRIDGGDALAALSRYAASAHARGLLPMLDLVIDQLDEEAVTDADISSWYKAGPAEDTPDPRLPPSQRGIATLASEASLSALSGWWSERLVSWIDVGICGFRCLHADRLPPALLHDLISNARKRAPDIRFLSSSSDHANAGSDIPKSVGFDLSLVNTQHWDFRSDWTWVEANGLGPTLPTIGTPEWPFGPRTANRLANKELAYRAAVRALRFASRLGDGWMMPMGFEFGARRAMDAIRDQPTDFMSLRDEAPHDLSSMIAEINDGIGARTVNAEHRPWRRITPARAPVAALLRPAVKATDAELLLINPSLAHAASIAAPTVLSAAALPGALLADPLGEPPVQPGDMLTLAPADVITFLVHPAPSIKSAVSPARRAAQQAAQAPRLAIECVTPSVDNGQFPVKRHVGESVTVAADIICDGHDHIAAALLWRPADQQDWHEVRMRLQGNDRWSGSFPLARLGRHYFTVVAWKDEFRNFAEELEKKHLAGLNVELELEEGRLLLEATLTQKPDPAEELKVLVKEVGASKGRQRLHLLLAANTAAIMHAADPRPFLVRHPISFPVEAERWAAGFGSWYEIFPRSQSGDPDRHGTFDDVIGRLPAIRDMGFDVLYFPPIHPIGSINRKGRNNATTAQPGDPGSPYAIGSAEGGHDALHPELGTFKDFARLIRAAEQHGLEIALDFAIQCAPDHPWLKQHRGWFKWRPDGSMRYAENPPKKYEDIVNVDFYAAQAIPGLWLALRDVILFWVKQGVRIFRVDNPHTKPFAFWEWMIRDVRTRHPDVIFLSEAFTRPKVMYRLAKIGFSQSYTYFTWRNEKHELQDYLIELAAGPAKEFFRPHFFVNTPDINPFFLQTSGRAGFLIRAALAGTLSGLFGVYNGFELCEGRGLPGREEYLDSEKYEIRAWDWNREGNIVREITMLNRIRRSNPALQTHLGLRFHHADNDQIICYSKTTSDRSNLVLVAVSLDPFTVQECDIEVPLWTWGLPDDATIDVDDLMDGRNIAWHGKTQRIRLDPEKLPFAIWRLNPPEGSLT